MRKVSLRLLLVGLGACATTRSPLVDAATCESFEAVDTTVRSELDRLLASAPGEVLVQESSRLNLARRSCARHRLRELLSVRESGGIQAMQLELDAMAKTYAREELRALSRQELGDDSSALEPMLAEAHQRHERAVTDARLAGKEERSLAGLAVTAPRPEGPEPTLPDSMCDASTPCTQLECVAREGGALDASARACLDSARALSADQRAGVLGRLLALLPAAPSGPRTEATLELDMLRRVQWPLVEADVAARHPGAAAQRASPFGVLPSVSARVELLRDAAQAHHLARAKQLEAFPDARWLHRALAASFGGPQVDDAPTPGRWETPRWRCPGAAPELPRLLPGMTGVLSVRCETPRAASSTAGPERAGDMKTFELERSLKEQRVSGSLTIACGDRSNLFQVSAADVESVPLEIERQLDAALTACTSIHQYAALRSCTEFNRRTAGELTARFVDHARYTRKWEPCFVDWLLTVEGVSPPALPTALRRE